MGSRPRFRFGGDRLFSAVAAAGALRKSTGAYWNLYQGAPGRGLERCSRAAAPDACRNQRPNACAATRIYNPDRRQSRDRQRPHRSTLQKAQYAGTSTDFEGRFRAKTQGFPDHRDLQRLSIAFETSPQGGRRHHAHRRDRAARILTEEACLAGQGETARNSQESSARTHAVRRSLPRPENAYGSSEGIRGPCRVIWRARLFLQRSSSTW